MKITASQAWIASLLLVLSTAWPHALLGACDCCNGAQPAALAFAEALDEAPVRSCCSSNHSACETMGEESTGLSNNDNQSDSDEPCSPGTCHCPRPCCATASVAVDLSSEASHPDPVALPDVSVSHIEDLSSAEVSDEIPHPPKA